MKKFLLAALFAPLAALAATEVQLDSLPGTPDSDRLPSLQRGVQTFVNYCLNCHSAAFQRWNRLTDLGLTEQQIKANLMFGTDKIGSTMTVAMDPKEAAEWFGTTPPDLTLVARVRGGDWLYTYLRGFYRDEATATGWNNVAFPNVAMPHVLWQLQGIQAAEPRGREAHGPVRLRLESAGIQSAADYDRTVRDLVNFLVYLGEPVRDTRIRIGIVVVLFLTVVLLPLAYLLKKEFWKDVH
jgi:ubiquinol-cytochrome c reductase cytochrome c1 subunit